jgi:hypothetical protein
MLETHAARTLRICNVKGLLRYADGLELQRNLAELVGQVRRRGCITSLAVLRYSRSNDDEADNSLAGSLSRYVAVPAASPRLHSWQARE